MSSRDGSPRITGQRENTAARVRGWKLHQEDASGVTALEQQLNEARFLSSFCCAVYAQRDPKRVCATAAQWLYDYFRYRQVQFSFTDPELESVSFMPMARADKRRAFPASLVAPVGLNTRRLSWAGTSEESGLDITVRFATGAGQLRILEAEQGSHKASEDFLRSISNCLAAALDTSLEHARLQELSLRDGLTGLLNRRAFEALLDLEEERCEAAPASVVMVDIDNFKSINDRFGHPAGDKVIATVGKAILDVLRVADLAARYGGEEFALLLPGTTVQDGFSVAERVRKHIASICFEFSGHRLNVTASLGVANRCGKDDCSTRELLKLADEALYLVKRGGKNSVMVHGMSPAPSALHRSCCQGMVGSLNAHQA